MPAHRLDAALLDRDGTINVKAPEGEYVTSPRQLELLPGAAAAICALNRARVPVVVITNQRGIALGRMSEHDLALVHLELMRRLARVGARIDAFFHCPHERGACACRKPGTLMLRRAQAHLGLETLHHSLVVGDSLSDVLAGWRVGARTTLLRPAERPAPGLHAQGGPLPDDTAIAASLAEAVERALA